MAPLNFHQLRIFLSVAKHKSFSKAAQELYISQPAVSIQVKELEEHYDVSLLQRSGRKVVLTDIGETVYHYAQQIFSLDQDMEAAINDFKGLARGHLVIGASTTIGEYLLPEALGRFKERYPGIDVELEIANTSQIIERVRQHQVDIGFIGDEIQAQDLEVKPYMLDEIVVVTSPQNHLSQAGPVSTDALREEKFLIREDGSATRSVTDRCLSKLGFKPKVAMELGSTEALKRAVAANLGIAMLSKHSIAIEVSCGLLKIANVSNLDCRRPFSIIYRKNKVLSRAEKAFLGVVTLQPE